MEQEQRDAIETEIATRKQLLAQTDYKALKFAEGAISEKDYSETRKLRQGHRDAINDLEAQLAELDAVEAEE